ncbi:MAG: T9SS type B sorting domain-containing protein [Flavobacteriaceae bacterium]|nr:T9SS type B sorting domain-containing protein [Flavobacteriaceae bacterium]
MKSFWNSFLGFFFVLGLYAQDCPDLVSPINGALDVAVDSSISWNSVEGVTGYIISIGTTPGGADIIDQQPTGNTPNFTPPVGLPENTLIYVTITLFYFNLPDVVCPSKSFTTEDVTYSPSCTIISSPINGATDVNVVTNINWDYVAGATGYIITVGTAPGLGDIVSALDVGNTLFYNPPADFTADTQIYVEVIPYNENGNQGSCTEESFTTGPLAVLPDCSSIIYPIDGEINVALSPLIEWEAVPGAEGYIVYIGTSPFENDILDGGSFSTNSTFVINFEPNTVYFISIIPFNAAGEAIGCDQTSFSTILGCGPFLNPDTGQLETLYPELSFPDQVGICLNESPAIIEALDQGDGYRWYALNNQGEFVLISEENILEITETGTYRYEVYVLSDQAGIELECSSSKDFEVVSSESPTIEGVNITDGTEGFNIEVIVTGMGDYEYSLDSIDSGYQESNIFTNVEDASTVYVRDRNGCGIDQFDLVALIVKKGFPRFFTPNNDGINDFWGFIGNEDDTFQLTVIYIYDRFGKLLKTLRPYSDSWNGDFNGLSLPTSDYWYRALTSDGRSFSGHFSLKR